MKPEPCPEPVIDIGSALMTKGPRCLCQTLWTTLTKLVLDIDDKMVL